MSTSYAEFAADVWDESNRRAQIEIGGEEDEYDLEDGLSFATRTELGTALALREVVKVARDSRQPAPPMKAVDVDAPDAEKPDVWAVTDTCIGAALAGEPFPLLSSLLQRCGAATAPRLVRIDTQKTYDEFRASGSPELAGFRQRIEELERRLAQHARDPYAHERLADEIEDLVSLGAEVDQVLADRKVDMDLKPRLAGKIEVWRDGDAICASIKLSCKDGFARWCTSAEPVHKAQKEVSGYAAQVNAPPSVILGMLPAIADRLGAGTVIKELVAAAPSLLQRPELASDVPFVVRIEPKGNPALCALALLALQCKAGNAQACDEWHRLAATAHSVVKQAMGEALALAKKAS